MELFMRLQVCWPQAQPHTEHLLDKPLLFHARPKIEPGVRSHRDYTEKSIKELKESPGI